MSALRDEMVAAMNKQQSEMASVTAELKSMLQLTTRDGKAPEV